ncbi:hypothetical protein BJ508DRAFT_411711, partial [Ascobolus immersus RN42]
MRTALNSPPNKPGNLNLDVLPTHFDWLTAGSIILHRNRLFRVLDVASISYTQSLEYKLPLETRRLISEYVFGEPEYMYIWYAVSCCFNIPMREAEELTGEMLRIGREEYKKRLKAEKLAKYKREETSELVGLEVVEDRELLKLTLFDLVRDHESEIVEIVGSCAITRVIGNPDAGRGLVEHRNYRYIGWTRVGDQLVLANFNAPEDEEHIYDVPLERGSLFAGAIRYSLWNSGGG